jgi:hypothetical protein
MQGLTTLPDRVLCQLTLVSTEVPVVTGVSDLKLLERDAFRKFYEDGLTDVFFGLMLMTMGIGAVVTDWLDSEAGGMLGMLGIAVILVTLLTVGRRRLLRSRLGDFKPGPERRRKITATRLALLGSVVVGLAAFALGAIAYGADVPLDTIDVLMPLLWFVNAVVVLSAMAYYLDVPRFSLYGFLFGMAMPLLVWPDVLWGIRLPAWLAIGAPGLPIVVIGLFKLRHFVRRWPVLPTAEGPLRDGR